MMKKLGLILVLFSLILMSFYYVYQLAITRNNMEDVNNYIEETIVVENQESTKIETKKEERKTNYMAVLEIPSIKLKQGIVNATQNFDSINYAVSADNNGNYPDQEGNFILYAHSGNSIIAYFDDLHKVNLEDDVYVYFKGTKYHYKVFNKFNIEKNGKLNVLSTTTKKYITLITCNQQDKEKQIVIIGNLIDEIKY